MELLVISYINKYGFQTSLNGTNVTGLKFNSQSAVLPTPLTLDVATRIQTPVSERCTALRFIIYLKILTSNYNKLLLKSLTPSCYNNDFLCCFHGWLSVFHAKTLFLQK